MDGSLADDDELDLTVPFKSRDLDLIVPCRSRDSKRRSEEDPETYGRSQEEVIEVLDSPVKKSSSHKTKEDNGEDIKKGVKRTEDLRRNDVMVDLDYIFASASSSVSSASVRDISKSHGNTSITGLKDMIVDLEDYEDVVSDDGSDIVLPVVWSKDKQISSSSSKKDTSASYKKDDSALKGTSSDFKLSSCSSKLVSFKDESESKKKDKGKRVEVVEISSPPGKSSRKSHTHASTNSSSAQSSAEKKKKLKRSSDNDDRDGLSKSKRPRKEEEEEKVPLPKLASSKRHGKIKELSTLKPTGAVSMTETIPVMKKGQTSRKQHAAEGFVKITVQRVDDSTKAMRIPSTFSEMESDVERVLEMFPTLEADTVRQKYRQIRSQFQNNILERVVDSIVSDLQPAEEVVGSATQTSTGVADDTTEEDIQVLLGNPKIEIRVTEESSKAEASHTEKPVKSDNNKTTPAKPSESSVSPIKKYGKGSKMGDGSKGKGPAEKKNRPNSSTVSYAAILDSDSEEESHISKDVEMDLQSPVHEQKVPDMEEVTSSVLECEACKVTENTSLIVQCCDCHLICSKCVEKQVKVILAPDNKEAQVTCPAENCLTYIPESQAKRVLPSLIIELLQDKLSKQAIESISKSEDLYCCPFCQFPVVIEHKLKEFECPNNSCKKKSCRYCKRPWQFADHSECDRFTSQEEENAEEFTLPKYWHPMEDTSSESFTTVLVEPNSREYSRVLELCKQSLPLVTSIRRIQNPRLWQKFSLARKHMLEDIGRQSLNEKQLFHGTNCLAVEAICRDGLDWRMCGVNGTALGQGTYFAKDAKYSDGYSNVYSKNNPGLGSGFGSGFGFGFSIPVKNKGSKHSVHVMPPGNPGPYPFVQNVMPAFGFGGFSPAQQQPNAANLSFGNVNSSTPSGFVQNMSNTNVGFSLPQSNSKTGPMFGAVGNIVTTGPTLGSSGNAAGPTFGHTVAPPFGNTSGLIMTNSGKNQKSNNGFGTITYGTPFGQTQTSGPCDSTQDASVPNVTGDVGKILKEGHKYMFVARVLVGRCTKGVHGMRKPPIDENDPKKRLFNSCVNHVQQPSIFVIFDSSQCYPEYLLEYTCSSKPLH